MQIQLPSRPGLPKILFRWIAFSLVVMMPFAVFGQNIEDNYPVKRANRNPDGTYTLIQFAPEKGVKKPLTLSTQNLGSILGLPVSNELKLKKEDAIGAKPSMVYEQFFRGIPLAFSRVMVQAPAGEIKSIAGRYYQVPEKTLTRPDITEASALEKALSFFGAKKYVWESQDKNEPELKTRPKGELVLLESGLSDSHYSNKAETFILCYKFNIYAVEPLRYEEVYVDAGLGKVVFTNPIIKHGEGIAATRYSGQRTINTINYGGNYVLVDTNRNHPVETLNLKKGSTYNTATPFLDKDNQWTAAEFNNVNLDNAALDAHWGSSKTFEFFKTVFNRNGFDGKGTPLKNYVHAGNKYSNAFWDGYSVTYGDGDSVFLGPLTSIDICGHEIAHGICQYSANLIYINESGAMNESLSDIWGACVKHFAAPEKNHWLMGDEISLNNSFIRSFINPKSQTQPDTYKGTNWYTGDLDNGGVHINSGVMNYWFYLLVTGKTGTNDHGFNYNVQGIGMEKAAAIVYRAETEYLYPTAQMIDARLATLVAAADLYGENATEFQQVKNAWEAVGVMGNLSTPSKLLVSDSNNAVFLKWSFPDFITDFDGFIIERKTGYDGPFYEIGRVAAGELAFWDITFSPNELLTYRVRAFKGSILSDFSSPVYISRGNGPLVMKTGTFTVCDKLFLDPGGPLNYNNGSNIITTIRPSVPGKKLGIRFLKFSLDNPYDYLEVFNGSNTTQPRLGTFRGNTIPPQLKSTDTSGALTFRFYSDGYKTDSGWVAELICIDSITPRPQLDSVTSDLSNGFVDLFWTDPSNSESGFIIQRAVNDSSNLSFSEIARVSANTTSFRDSSFPINSALFYRVVAYYLGDTAISNIKLVYSGEQPFIMNHGYLISTCNKTFLDPGGFGKYPVPAVNTSQVVVFIPSKQESKVEIDFSRFKLNNYDYLKIYNGWGTDKPVIGTYNSYSPKPAKIRSTSADGRLTVEFYRYFYGTPDSGWVANVGCYSYISQPVLIDLIPNGDPATEVKLVWMDRSNIEESYIVQRAINDNTEHAFKTLKVLPPNTTFFTDTLPQNDVVYFYRIIGTSKGDTIKSNIWEYYAGNYPILMPNNAEFVTCDKTFMDPAGLGIYTPPSEYTTIRTTFAPGNPNEKLMVNFSSLKLGENDILSVFEGATAYGKSLGSFSKTGPVPTLLKSTSADGKLTFQFMGTSYGTKDSGWVAKISCYKAVQKPVIDSIVKLNPKGTKIYWKESSGNSIAYIVQRSLNDSTGQYMKTVATLPAGIKFFEDTATIENAWVFYRVLALNEKDTAISLNKEILIGNAPYNMNEAAKITSCYATLLDLGGVGTYPYFLDNPVRKSIIFPDGPDKKQSIEFVKLDLTPSETIKIYDGNTVSSPYLIAEFTSGSAIPPIIKSKAKSGILTILYNVIIQNMQYGTWEAKISCYTPLPAPNLDSVFLKTQKMNVQWTDRSSTESSFIVQRALNDSTPGSFETIAQLSANINSYSDGSYPANGFLFYRVGAILGEDTSYSRIVQVRIGRVPIIMNDDYKEITTCEAVLLDPGGLGDYSKFPQYNTFIALIKPGKINTISQINFTKFNINYGDFLEIYSNDGSNPGPENLIGSYDPYNLPPANIRSQSPDGMLYLIFYLYSDPKAYPEPGWVANISCYKPLKAPEWVTGTLVTGNKVSLKWKNTPDDETQYLVQHAVNQPHFQPGIYIGTRSPNDTAINHNTPQTDAVNFYRVASVRGIDTTWSEVFSIAIGNSPFISSLDSVIVTCEEVFMDPGGIGNYPAPFTWEEILTTFVPGISGKKIGIDFKSFKLDWPDAIQIFNGDFLTTENLIDTYYGYETRKPGRILSKSPDGKLTIRFQRHNGSLSDSGWLANVFCYDEISRPTNPIVKRAGENRFKINFKDNSSNESGFVLEKCAGECNNFMPVDTLEQNMTEFIDSVSPNIGQVRYRVRAISQDFTSAFSDTAILMKANGALKILNANVSLESMDFYDSGGKDLGYTYNEKYQVRFYPLDSARKIKLTFETFSTEAGYDIVQIFDGAQPGAKRIALLSGTTVIPPITSKSGDGSLRFSFNSNDRYYYTDLGWKAKVTTSYGLQPPYAFMATLKDNSHVLLNWSDTNKLPVQFVVERSYNDTLHFAPAALVSANMLSFVDSNVVSNAKIYYRVAASMADEKSNYSQYASQIIGTNCINPALTMVSAKSTSLVNQVTNFLADKNCNLIAKIESLNSSPINLNKVQASVWVTDTFPSYNGAKYGKRHFNIVPENYTPGNSSWLTLYFTQQEFDEYNSKTNWKLLPRFPGDTALYKNIRILSAASSSIELQPPGSYPIPPAETVINAGNISYNAGLNAYEIKVLLSGPSAFFLSSANDTITTSCILDNDFVSVQSNKSGYTYQWQKEVPGGFLNLQDDSNFTFTRTPVLQFRKSAFPEGAKLRCMVFFSPSKTFVIENKEMEWTGVADNVWSNPANWSCGKVPGPANRVRIKAGTPNLPVISTNITLKDLMVFPGANITVLPGVQVTLTN